MDNLILTIIAAGLFGGILFLIFFIWALAAKVVLHIDAWSSLRATAKTDLCILVDRIHRGWTNMLPVFRIKHGDIWGDK